MVILKNKIQIPDKPTSINNPDLNHNLERKKTI